MTTTRIQGVAYSWAEIRIRIQWDGGEYVSKDYCDINWTQSLKGSKVAQTGPHMENRTTGQYECAGDVTMYMDEYYRLIAALSALNPSYGLAEFDVLAQWDDGSKVRELLLERCRIEGDSGGCKPGAEPNQIKVPLSVILVRLDGLTLLAPAL
jgi:hypothetical protein